MNIVQLKHQMRQFAATHHIPENPRMIMVPVWGSAAKQLCWRITGHLVAAKKMSHQTDLPEALWKHWHPTTVQDAFRAKIAHGYDSLNGVRYGSSKQREIADFCGLPWTLPWCAETFWYVSKHLCGYNGPQPANVAYVPAYEEFARAHGIIVPFRQARPGMACTFVWSGWHGIGQGDHIGIIDQKSSFGLSSMVATDEGNHLGAVLETKRYWTQVNCIFDLAKLQK